ncbi:formylglycine-generating enzyme required for sulfatase activity [Mucilaginibacter dorajii]|nr:formylglycine-generating enzyme family protein [Mucilaginibacter dorajii]MCS3733538.1 formylglycine-generating enzyme required for sulfatase activity [Mucilaginibacter dorajii]
MRPKFILLIFLAFIYCACLAQKRVVTVDTKNMVLVKSAIYFRGLDSARLKAAIDRYHLPADFFSQEYPEIKMYVPAFYIDKYEVTNADYKKFVEANPQWSKANIPDSLYNGDYLKDWKVNNYPKGKGDHPVVYVSFLAANAYAKWVGKRLPNEAELEYAAKGTQQQPADFPWGNNDADRQKANFIQSGIGQTTKVGSYAPNTLGLYDMAGNVFEFCLDLWRQDEYVELKKAIISKNFFNFSPPDRHSVAIRGGSWNDEAVKLRTTYRQKIAMTDCSPYVGFRCAVRGPKNKDGR